MASVTIFKTCFYAGAPISAGATLSVSLAECSAAVAGRLAYWSSVNGPCPALPNQEGDAFLAPVSSLAAIRDTGLASYTTAHVPTGRVFTAIVSGAKKTFQLQVASGLTADGVSIISPPDFDSTDNNRFLVQIF